MSALPFDQRDGFIWMNGSLVAWKEAKLHVLSHGLHYASCVFEGERAYGGRIFKSAEHSERFKTSAELLDFEIPYSVAELDKAKQLVVDKNNLPNCYVRPIAWRGSEMMAVAAQNSTINVAIAVWDWPSMFDIEQKMQGIRLDVSDYRRPDPITAPARAKAAGLYMICTISKHRAERRGYADAMMLDWLGRVAECFLDGITRRTVIDLAKRRGIEVIERRIMPDELSGFEECFISGTGAEVTPVSEAGPYNFKPGAISRALIDDYSAEVRPKQKAA
jgi:branched-chain amino acid aminotransferase